MSIRKLIEAVERGERPRVAKYDLPHHFADYVGPAFNGSLDAAHALHKAVLPGWTWVGGDMCEAMTVFPPGYDQDPAGHVDAYHADPARAWLLAILKALEQEKTDE